MHTLRQNKPQSNGVALSERLFAIAESLPKGGVVCDVGSDHGALPLFLLKEGRCKKAIVTDLNKKPLQRAMSALEEGGVSHMAEFVLTDGIAEVLSFSPDAFVIAGMGGETIAGILQRGLKGISAGTRFSLQPMTKSVELRRFLYENGFQVTEERLVCENGKFFLIVNAVFDGICRSQDDDFYAFGEYIPLWRGELARRYFSLQIEKIRARIKKKERAGYTTLSERKEEAIYLAFLKNNENL